jgi:agmatine deiminase
MEKKMSTATSAPQFRMPAEWECHDATWLCWPTNRNDWPGKIEPIPWVFTQMAKKLSEGEIVRIIVQSAEHEKKVRKILKSADVELKRIEFYRIPTNRGWTRDMGPIFTYRGSERDVAVLRFRFRAWSKYRDWKKDDLVHMRAAKLLKLPLVPAIFKNKDVELEGGSIDVNGSGAVLTTEECLLDPKVQVRNPGFTREDYDAMLKQYLGVEKVIWLGHGIAGDDTHGHVDDLCRFVNTATVVLSEESNPQDVNYKPLQENKERLQGIRLAHDEKLAVISLPMPDPVLFNGRRLPASYANFYIGNTAVIVPTFNDPNDRIALGILSDLFPGRKVVGIHALDLVLGQGTLHCLTQQQPSQPYHE